MRWVLPGVVVTLTPVTMNSADTVDRPTFLYGLPLEIGTRMQTDRPWPIALGLTVIDHGELNAYRSHRILVPNSCACFGPDTVLTVAEIPTLI